MNNEYLQNLSESENNFIQEVKGGGSLSAYAVTDTAKPLKDALRDEVFYIGYDIHPENLESLHFDGLKLPRWENIQAATTEQKMKIYQKSVDKNKSDYPFISRVMDTDEQIVFALEEISQLSEECERVLATTTDSKVVEALLKFYIACNKANERQMGLLLIPN